MKFHALSVILMASVLGACVTDDDPAYYNRGGYYESRPVVVQERYYRESRGPRYTPSPVYDRYPPPGYYNRPQWRPDTQRPPHWRDDNRRPGWQGQGRPNNRPDYGRDDPRRPDSRPDRPNARPDRPDRPDNRPNQRPDRPNNQRPNDGTFRPGKGGFSVTPIQPRNNPQQTRGNRSNEPEVIMGPDQPRRR